MISGKSLCFTGSMKQSRKEIERMARSHGASVSHKVTKSTDYLVSAGGDSSKLSQAWELGVEVISFEQFMAMV